MNGTAYNHDSGTMLQAQQERPAAADTDNHLSFSAIVLFMLCLATTLTLLIVAAVIWLSEIMGSTVWACLAAGGAAAIISLVIYLVSVHRTIRTLHKYMDTVYETSNIAKSGYEKIKTWIDYLL